MNDQQNARLTQSIQAIDEDSVSTLSSTGGLKHESAERIFHLLQFLMANECTRKDVF